MKKLIVAASVMALFTGCSSSTPDCSSSEAVDLVLQITRDEMLNYVSSSQAEALDYRLDAIRTRSRNEEVDSYRCAAELTISGLPQGSVSDGIEYTIESTDSGDEFYVEVFGL